MKKFRTALICLLAALVCCSCSFALSACWPDKPTTDIGGSEEPGDEPGEDPDPDPDPEPDPDPDPDPDPEPEPDPDPDPDYDGLFVEGQTSFTLSADYTITKADAEYTGGTDGVELGYICSFDLGGHTLDLGGMSLDISDDKAGVVTFKNGTITNGKLNISVPKGDITFDSATIDESVEYSLEAASDTIRFSNARVNGKCTVKSNSRVQIEYSSVTDITLEGDGNLVAGKGAEVGTLTVGKQASGASVTVTGEAVISAVAVQAAAEINVAGSVSSVKVEDSVKQDKAELKITVNENAAVDNIELHAAADVKVAGTVSSVKVAETAKEDSAELKIDVAESATVTAIELNASASVNVAGNVQAVMVTEAAKEDTADMNITVAQTAEVARVELNSSASVEVSGSVNNVVVKEQAADTSVTVKENATVTTIAVQAENTKIESESEEAVNKVYVSENVSTDNMTGVTTDTMTEEILEEISQHTCAFVTISRTEATCEKEGVIEQTCVICGQNKETKIPALGHKEVYTVIRPATATETGLAIRSCTRCGKVIEQIVLEKRAALVIDGLDWLYSQIPDGTYVLEADQDDNLFFGQNGNDFTIESGKAVFEVENGSITGSLEATVTITSVYDGGSSVMTVNVKGATDGNAVYIYFDQSQDYYNGSEYYYEGTGYITLSSVVTQFINAQANIDIDDIYAEYSSFIEWLSGSDAQSSFLEGLLKDAVNGIFAKEEKDGTVSYTFSHEKAETLLNGLKTKTAAQLADDILGEGMWAEIESLADSLTDGKTTVSDLADRLFTYVENSGITKEQLFDLAGKLLSDMTGTEIDIDKLVEDYAAELIPDALADYMSGDGQAASAQDMAAAIAQYVEQIKQFAQMTVPEIWQMLQDGAVIPPEAGTFEDLADMLAYYSKYLTVTATVGADGKMTNLSAIYEEQLYSTDGETGETTPAGSNVIFTFNWNEDDKVPQITLDLGEYAGSLEGDENAAQLILAIMGIEGEAGYKKTEEGAEITAVASIPAEDGSEIELGEVKLDVALTANGADITLGGTLYEPLFMLGNGSAPQPSSNKNDVTLGGILHAYKDPSASADAVYEENYNIWKELLYHADIHYEGGDSQYSEKFDLEFVSDETGEYYNFTITNVVLNRFDDATVTVSKTTTTLRLASVNGMPDIMASYSPDCGDWININFAAYGMAHVTDTYINGTPIYDKEGGYITGAEGTEDTNEYTTTYPITGGGLGAYFYYNPVTGETSGSSKHEYSYTGTYLEEELGCDGKIKVTRTCINCGESETFITTGHYFVSERTPLVTSCDGESAIVTEKCIMCGETRTDITWYSHNIYDENDLDIISAEDYAKRLEELTADGKYTEEQAREELDKQYVNAAVLAKDGYDTDGLYHGTLHIRHCSSCGLDVFTYEWYTYTQEEGCLLHTVIKAHYDGNAYFEGFDKVATSQATGHYYYDSWEEADVEEAVKFVQSVIGEELPFTAASADIMQCKCMGCELLESERYELRDGNGNYFYLTVYYEDGKMTANWNYDYETSDWTKVSEYALQFAGMLNGNDIDSYKHGSLYEYVSHGDDYEHRSFRLYMYAENGNDLYPDGDEISIEGSRDKNGDEVYGNLNIREKDFSTCSSVVSDYEAEGDGWTLSNRYENYADHTYVYVTVHGENDAEDGWYEYMRCASCGAADNTNFNINFWHPDGTYYREEDELTEEVKELLTYNQPQMLEGLQAKINYNQYYCCDAIADVVIMLTADWTLTSDAYIRAEGLTIDLSGHSIDLNGYNLALYSYAGAFMTITDNAFDTSLVTGENYEYTSSIKDSSAEDGTGMDGTGTGLLIAFVNGGYLEIGSVNINAASFLSDYDNRYTIYDSVADYGIELEMLKPKANSLITPHAWASTELGMQVYNYAGFEQFGAENDMLVAENYDATGKLYVVGFSCTLTTGQQLMLNINTYSGRDDVEIYADGGHYGYYSNGTFEYYADFYDEDGNPVSRTVNFILVFHSYGTEPEYGEQSRTEIGINVM